MKPEDRARMARYRARAEACLQAMELVIEEPDTYRDVVVLLAVQGAIAIADAEQVAFTGHHSTGQDHQAAASELRKLCGRRKIDAGGVDHFTWLLARKTRFSYGDHRVSNGEMIDAANKAKRFSKWVYTNFPEIARDEEDHA
jgi:hypothetical protein